MEHFVEASTPSHQTIAPDAEQPDSPTYLLGDALRRARLQLTWSLSRASTETGLSTRVLNHIEAGIRIPSGDVLATIADAYNVDPRNLEQRPAATRVAPAVEPKAEHNGTRIAIGPIEIVVPHGAPNAIVLDLFAEALRSIRCLESHQPAYIRDPELPVLALLLDAADPDLAFESMHYLGLTWLEAGVFMASLQATGATTSRR